MGKTGIKRFFKVTAIVVAALLLLDLMLVGLILVPKVQTFVVNKITSSLSEKWGSEFSIDKVWITPTLKVVAQDVVFKDHHNNNMIYSEKVKGRLKSLKFKPFQLGLGDVVFERPEITLRTYKGEDAVNISIWANKIPKSDTHSDFILTSNSAKIHNGNFVLINDNTRTVFDTKGNPDIDYSFFELADISLDADDFYLKNADVSMKIKDLSFSQYGGFDLKKASGDFRICDTTLVFNNLKLKTKDSDLDLDLVFRYDNWQKYGEFVDSIQIVSTIRPSVLAMGDVAGFAPAIKGMNEVFYLSSEKVEGYVSDFKLDKAKVEWLGNNKIAGDISIKNVVDFKNAYLDLNFDSASVNVPDVKMFTLPGGKTIPINSTISKFGYTTFNGGFTGTLDQFVADIDANCGLGPVKAYLETDPNNGRLKFYGNLASDNFNIAKLIGNNKVLGSSSVDLSLDGVLPSGGLSAENIKNADAHLYGNVNRLRLLGYPLRRISVEGDCKDGLFDATLTVRDSNLTGSAVAQLDISREVPSLQGNISLQRFAIGDIASSLPKVDSATATGIDKFIAAMQRNPSVNVSFDNLQVVLNGNNINNVNGFLGCDNVKLKYNEDSLQNERLRLTALNNENVHKFLLSSNIANASFETSYPLNSVVDSLQNIAHRILPSLVKPSKNHIYSSETDENGYLKLTLRTYNTRPLTKIFMPELMLAPNSEVNIAVHNDNTPEVVQVKLPFFGLYNKFRLHNFTLDGISEDGESLDLVSKGDSVIVHVGQGKLVFDKVDLKASEKNNMLDCDLSWHNPFNSQKNISNLKGSADISSTKDLIVRLKPSQIYIKDYLCHFNDSNEVHIKPNKYEIDNLTFSTSNSSIALNGTYATKEDSRLTAALKNIDMSLINPLLDNMSFGGRLFANLSLNNRDGKSIILGKTIIDELDMNESRLGDVFLVAGMNDEKDMRFAGGLFNADFPLTFETLSSYTMQSFQDEKNKTANISGTYANKDFYVKAVFDTLQADFLSPFLSSFSDKLTGIASGDLAFHASPDSTYFDGTVHVIDANMNISALGTEYNVVDQDIMFNKDGIFFDEMQIRDVEGNVATMSGQILHDMFKNMQFDLQIHADRIMALNAPKTTNSVFYGTGFVNGDVFIYGDESGLSFVGPAIKTLEGSRIVLQVSSSNSASETDLIRFKPNATESKTDVQYEEPSSMALNFDFTFDVTNDADIVLILESIGGTMNARADGRFRLSYNSNDALNLYGNLLLHSGDFKISLYDVVNSKFTLVQGGTINFDGPLENMTVDLMAYKTSKTSLANIIPAEYLPSGNVNVNAGLHLNGPLMQRIEPTFSFELPNSSSEVRNLFYTAIDTQNTENMTKQFAYFLITNTFMPQDMFANSSNGPSGLGIFSNIVNNMLGNVIDSKIGTFGITYNQATETSSAEYGVKANANILKDRMTMSTSIGYYDDRTASDAYNNIYGDFSVEYNINKTGTWKLKAYTYIGDRDDDYFYENNYNNYTAGVAMTYKRDFDTKSKKKKNKTKKNVKEDE